MADTRKIVFYDGVCNFCNSTVQKVFKHDRKGNIYYAHLQGKLAQDILPQFKINPSDLNSFVYYNGEKAFTKSSAFFQLCYSLGFPYHLLTIFRVIPPFISNIVYNWIAKNRYKWFGKKEHCQLPSQELRIKFID